METTLSTTAAVSATLLGIGVAVAAVLPPALELLSGKGSNLQLRLSLRRIRYYFVAIALATLVFALCAVTSVLGLALGSSVLCAVSVATCVTGIAVLGFACGGIFLELVPTLRR